MEYYEDEKYIIEFKTGLIWSREKKMYLGYKNKNRYIRGWLDGKHQKHHRYIYEKYYGVKLSPEQQINHINNIRDDNRIENLEIVSHHQNQHWRGKNNNNTSGHKNICWEKNDKRWRAMIRLNNIIINLGSFTDINDAIIVRDKKIAELNLQGHMFKS